MKNLRINIREAVENDIPAMLELWKEMMDFHKECDRFFSRTATAHKAWVEFITSHISNNNSCVLVAERNGRIVGHCLAFTEKFPPVLTTKRYGLFQEIAVAAKHRRCGVGENLFNKTLKWFREHGIKRIEVRVSVCNELSTAFWRKMGFKPYLETLCFEV